MHELSMADAMVKTVLDVAEKNDATEVIRSNYRSWKTHNAQS